MNGNLKYIIGSVGLLLLGGIFIYTQYFSDPFTSTYQTHTDEVHVHSDFLFYILDNKVDLTAGKYQSSSERVNHKSIHFHDGVDTQIHRHADGITLSEFLDSIGFTLTDTCIITDENKSFCSDEQNQVLLFVNGIQLSDITQYITAQADQILLYYGDPDSPLITTYEGQITDEACIYSGTCPERGDPPFESCGLTCEI